MSQRWSKLQPFTTINSQWCLGEIVSELMVVVWRTRIAQVKEGALENRHTQHSSLGQLWSTASVDNVQIDLTMISDRYRLADCHQSKQLNSWLTCFGMSEQKKKKNMQKAIKHGWKVIQIFWLACDRSWECKVRTLQLGLCIVEIKKFQNTGR